MTNFERIKNMTVEEMAKVIPCPYIKEAYDECKYGWHEKEETCEDCIKHWLESEVSE